MTKLPFRTRPLASMGTEDKEKGLLLRIVWSLDDTLKISPGIYQSIIKIKDYSICTEIWTENRGGPHLRFFG